MIGTSDIEARFTYHAPKAEQTGEYEELRARARNLAHYSNFVVPDGREKSLALTKLEEFVFWANAAIARARNDDA